MSDDIRLIQKIIASDGLAYEFFGYSVAISSDGNTLVAGANKDDGNGDMSGSIYYPNRVSLKASNKYEILLCVHG